MTRVLITRPSACDRIGNALSEAGFDVVPACLTNTVRASAEERARAVAALDPQPPAEPPAWVALTSPTGVRVLAETAQEHGHTLAELLAPCQVAAVGRATARSLAEHGVDVDLTPPDTQSDASGMLWALEPVAPTTMLLTGSAIASPVLAEGLRERGWDVRQTPTYTTETVDFAALDDDARADLTRLVAPWPDAAVVTSGSNACALRRILGMPPRDVAVVAIGRPTEATLTRLGIPVAARAAHPTPSGIVRATVRAVTGV